MRCCSRAIRALRVFPNWPKDRDARFGQFRAYGAFLVTSEIVKGEITNVVIESEKGRPCVLLNPWPSRRVMLSRNDGKAEHMSGPVLRFKTTAGELISVSTD